MYYCFCFVVILCYPTFAAAKYRDPHEMKIDLPFSDNPSSDESDCRRQINQEAIILKYYKKSLQQITAYVAPRRDDQYTYDFNLHISDEDYKRLKRAIDDINTDYDFEKLRTVHEVLSRVTGKRTQDWIKEEVLSWMEYIRMNMFTKEAAVLLFISLLPVLVYCYKHSSRQTIVLIVMFAMWGTDFGVTWFDKYEELEVDHMVDMSRYESSVPTCDLTQMYFWQRWFSSLSPTDECRRYYSAKYKNKNYQIGPYDVLIEQTGKLMKVCRFFAIEISQFLSLITQDIPWPLNWVVILLVVIGGFYILQLVLFILFGYSFEFNLAHLLNFAIKPGQNQRINNDNNREYREMVQEVRQLPIRMTEAIRQLPNLIRGNQPENIAVNNRIINASVAPNVPANERVINKKDMTTQITENMAVKEESASNLTHRVIAEDHRPDILVEDTPNNDKEESSSESIEVVGDTNRNADFEDYIVVNEGGGGDGLKLIDIEID